MDILIKVSDSGLSGLTFCRPSLTKKHFADECDLSKIVQRFIKTGELPNFKVKQPLPFQDISLVPEDFQAVMEFKVKASNMFESEPLEIRELFQHSVERYMEFKAGPQEQQEAFLKAHLCPPPAAPAPAAPAPAAPAPAAPAPAAPAPAAPAE